jgi:thiamine phosphate synthase YjbQ (UPF0047 family)
MQSSSAAARQLTRGGHRAATITKSPSPLLVVARRHRHRRTTTATATQTEGTLVNPHLRKEGPFISYYAEIELETLPGISLHELTPLVKKALVNSGVSDGTVLIQSRHTTVAVTVNEFESRLMDDLRQYLRKIAPASDPWLHNDLHLRYAPDGWPGGDDAWRAQEPINAQAHVQAMLLGSSSSLAVVGGEVKIGQWQSVIGVELDGKRTRRWGVAVQGLAAAR